ncbi:sensor histidine kinase [Streptomyces sp. NPDC049936]|uniref:sensor histidine kinase n=1 Tax=Streptomyces sp. NPDC049936 TaxID=3365599 RepID=UPI0037ABA111
MNPQAAPLESAQDRTHRMLVRALAALRGAQFLLWLVVLPMRALPDRHAGVIVGGYVTAGVFAAVMFSIGIRRRALPLRWIMADVALASVYAVVVSRSYPPADAASIANWVIPPLCGVTVTAAIYGGRYRVPAAAVVVASWIVGAWPAYGTANGQELISNTTMMAVFAGVAGLTGKLLLQAAHAADSATARAVEAEHQVARSKVRAEQALEFHDSVQATLDMIASGRYSAQKNQWLAQREADFLRVLTTSRTNGDHAELATALARMIRDHPAQELVRGGVETRIDTLPSDLPMAVVDALTKGAREALTNVVKYAQTDDVCVTAATNERGGVRVAVIDQGIGFDIEKQPLGLGIAHSIKRITDLGGAVDIDSAPGDGTIVEMTWTS